MICRVSEVCHFWSAVYTPITIASSPLSWLWEVLPCCAIFHGRIPYACCCCLFFLCERVALWVQFEAPFCSKIGGNRALQNTGTCLPRSRDTAEKTVTCQCSEVLLFTYKPHSHRMMGCHSIRAYTMACLNSHFIFIMLTSCCAVFHYVPHLRFV